jgi:tetratricopeptide (TPR) repeat protein
MSDTLRIENLRRRVQGDPASIAFAQLAEEHRRMGQYHDAVQVCRAGLAVHPSYLSARVTLGRALLELGELVPARHELQLVLASAPDNLAATRGLGEILQRQGALTEALGHYRRALGLARNDPDLEQTVADLTRELARRPKSGPAAAVTESSDLLSLEQLAQALQQQAGVSAPVSAAATERPDPGDDLRTLATLERWLTAIDGSRSERRA